VALTAEFTEVLYFTIMALSLVCAPWRRHYHAKTCCHEV